MQMVKKRSIRANSTKVLGMDRESLKKMEKYLKLIGLKANQMKKRSKRKKYPRWLAVHSWHLLGRIWLISSWKNSKESRMHKSQTL